MYRGWNTRIYPRLIQKKKRNAPNQCRLLRAASAMSATVAHPNSIADGPRKSPRPGQGGKRGDRAAQDERGGDDRERNPCGARILRAAFRFGADEVYIDRRSAGLNLLERIGQLARDRASAYPPNRVNCRRCFSRNARTLASVNQSCFTCADRILRRFVLGSRV